jgi:hypothetical protein
MGRRKGLMRLKPTVSAIKQFSCGCKKLERASLQVFLGTFYKTIQLNIGRRKVMKTQKPGHLL